MQPNPIQINPAQPNSTQIKPTQTKRIHIAIAALFIVLFGSAGLMAQTNPNRSQTPGLGDQIQVHRLLTDYADALAITESQKTSLMQLQLQNRVDRRANRKEQRLDGRRGSMNGRPGIRPDRSRMQQPQRMRPQGARMQGARMQGARMQGAQTHKGAQTGDGSRRGQGSGDPRTGDMAMQQAMQRLSATLQVKQEIADILTEEQLTGWHDLRAREIEREFDNRMLAFQVRLADAGIAGEKQAAVLDLLRKEAVLAKEWRIRESSRMEMPDEEEAEALRAEREAMRESRSKTNEQIKDVLTANEYQQFRRRF